MNLSNKQTLLNCSIVNYDKCPVNRHEFEWFSEEKDRLIRLVDEHGESLLLQLRDRKQSSAYQCVVRNNFGAIARTFSLRTGAGGITEVLSRNLEHPETDQFIWLPSMQARDRQSAFYLEDNAQLHCLFYVRSVWLRPKVNWYFTPHDAPKRTTGAPVRYLLNSSIPKSTFKSRYGTRLDRIPCSGVGGAWPIDGICFDAELTIFGVMEHDHGQYVCSIVSDHADPLVSRPANPNATKQLQYEFFLLPLKNPWDQFQSFDESINFDLDSSLRASAVVVDSTTQDDVSVTLASPPFEIHFNTNSTVCLNDNFTMQCVMDPPGLGDKLVLLRLDEHVDLRGPLADSDGILDLLNSTLLKESVSDDEPALSTITYSIFDAQQSDEGSYMCFGGLNGVQRMRWKAMHLLVKHCHDTFESRLHNLILSFPNNMMLLVPTLAILLVSLSVVVIRCHCQATSLIECESDVESLKKSNANRPVHAFERSRKKVSLVRYSNPFYPTDSLHSANQEVRPMRFDIRIDGDNHVPGLRVTGLKESDCSLSASAIYRRRHLAKRPLPRICRLSLTDLSPPHVGLISLDYFPNKTTEDVLQLSDPVSSVSTFTSGYHSARSASDRFLWLPIPDMVHEQTARVSVRCESAAFDYELPQDPEWELPRDCLRMGPKLGEGAFGVVYFARLSLTRLPDRRRKQVSDLSHSGNVTAVSSVPVAVKRLRADFSEQELMDLIRETEMMKILGYHPHLIQLYGACTQSGPLQVVVEYAPHGNLRDFLRARRQPASTNAEAFPRIQLSRPTLDALDLLNFGLQVAKGMDYLSSRSVVHRDLAARNVLVGENYVVKIADFGLTRAISDYYKKTSKGRLPVKWMAPESLFDRKYTTKSDVWSFGILLWEIFSMGAVPYPSIPPERLFNLLKAGHRNDCPPMATATVYQLMCNCWAEEPNRRPTFRAIVSQLSMLHQIVSLQTPGAVDVFSTALISSGEEEVKSNIFAEQRDECVVQKSNDETNMGIWTFPVTQNVEHYVEMTDGYLVPRMD